MEFIREMGQAYAAADIIISRAGALSISELCLVGKPVILVPSPNVAEDHQTRNAEALVKRDAAIMVKDGKARESLAAAAVDLIGNEDKRNILSYNIALMARKEAVPAIVREIRELIESRR